MPDKGLAAPAACDIRIAGMDCASCAASIEGALVKLEGVLDVRVDVVGGRARVRYAEGKLVRGDLTAAIERLGYSVIAGENRRARQEVGTAADVEAQENRFAAFWNRRGRVLMSSAAGAALAIGIAATEAGAPKPWILVLLGVSTIAGGWFVVPRGLRAARNRALDMNFLMSVAAAGAWIIGEQTEAAATLFLFAVAELLEAYSMDRARNAIRALMDLSPAEANVLRDGREMRVAVEDIEVDETVIVRPGEKISVDGVVISGKSSVNQAPITGESMPVFKEKGSAAFAGTLNGEGMLRLRSTKPANDTTLARIIHAVEEAQSSKAPTQRFVDRFARVYTPSVVAAAVLLAVIPPAVGLGEWSVWIYRALAMLVVACPCALVISTPVSIVSGLAGAARRGVLIKGGAHLEAAGGITTVCFDKTGTLTRGFPAVTDVAVFPGSTFHDVLEAAMAVEHGSEHPLAKAVLEHGGSRGIGPPDADDFQALVGRGARARVSGRDLLVGNARLLDEIGARTSATDREMSRFEGEGKTVVAVIADGAAIGIIAIADEIRPNASCRRADPACRRRTHG